MKVTKGTEDAEEEGREGIFFLQQPYHLSIYHHQLLLVHPLIGIVIFIQQIIYPGFLSR